jgi:hypothetical protein
MSQEENKNNSEVTNLLQRFDAEFEAAQRALYGFAHGTTQHSFITQKMENMRVLQEMISEKVGEEEATRLVVEHMDAPCKKSKEGPSDGKE